MIAIKNQKEKQNYFENERKKVPEANYQLISKNLDRESRKTNQICERKSVTRKTMDEKSKTFRWETPVNSKNILFHFRLSKLKGKDCRILSIFFSFLVTIFRKTKSFKDFIELINFLTKCYFSRRKTHCYNWC